MPPYSRSSRMTSTRKALLLLALLLLVSAAVAGVKYHIDRSACVGCGDCFRICPVDAVQMRDGKAWIDPEACIDCGLCQGICTHDAVR